NIQPYITAIKFLRKDRMSVHLRDGREIVFPIEVFPEIAELSPLQRKHWQILGGEGFTFDDCPEVFHIEQILGTYEVYSHK
ncbi:MAG: DUF2442 domain-containing protein, partial [Cytophagales bacterium]